MSKHHYFIALALSMEEKGLLTEKAEQLGIRSLFKKWVHPEDFHLTLAFLGAANRESLLSLMDRIEGKLQSSEAFSLILTRFGTFGREERPRIFFLAPRPEEMLEELQAIVADCCRSEGFSIDEKPFNPHITVARNYIGERDFSAADLERYSHSLDRGTAIAAEKVCLYETHIEKVPKYKEIRSIILKK